MSLSDLRRFFLSAIIFVAGARAETRLARVEAVDLQEQQLIVAYLRSHGQRPAALRCPGVILAELKAGEVIRIEMAQYEGVWWIDGWWPIAPEAERTLAEDRFWDGIDGIARGLVEGLLGLDIEGQLVDLKSERFRHGCFLVPYVRSAEEGRPPVAMALMEQFAKRLATTPHRDLPIVFWSLHPAFDRMSQIESWRAGLGEAANEFIWVSGFEEWQEHWQERFSVVLFRVKGQPAMTNPVVLVLDPAGEEILRYEGGQWAEDWLVSDLDEALLSAPR